MFQKSAFDHLIYILWWNQKIQVLDRIKNIMHKLVSNTFFLSVRTRNMKTENFSFIEVCSLNFISIQP